MQNAIRSLLRYIVIGFILFVSLATLASAAYAQIPTENVLNRATFGDWLLNCESLSTTQEPECRMTQRIEFEDNSEPLLIVDLYLNPKDSQPEAIFLLPLGIPLQNNPILTFNFSKSLTVQVSHCHINGCYFKTQLKNTLLEAFLSMTSAELKLSGNKNEVIKIPISGSGSRAAFNHFTSLLSVKSQK